MQDHHLDYETLDRLLAQHRGRSHVPCPVCGPHHRRVKAKLKIWRGNKPGVLTYACARCGVHGVAFANGHIQQGWHPYHRSSAPAPVDGGETRRRYASRIAHASRSAAGTLAEAYLRSRAITLLPPPRIRFHPNLKYPDGTRWPAMVVAVVNAAGTLCGVQRTYLARDGKGKAPLDPNKLTLGPIAGGGAWLGDGSVRADPDGVVIIAEGIETALSASQLFHRPAWAALGATLMQRLVLPETHRDLVICADRDPVGARAAYTAAERFAAQGRRVRVVQPPAGYKDFNDFLRGCRS